MVKDPVAAAEKVEKQLDQYIEQIRILRPLHEQRSAEAKAARTRMLELNKTDEAAARGLRDSTVAPLEREAHSLFVNLRFQCLSALSLRRFVQGRLYLLAKTQHITQPTSSVYQEFLRAHGRILQKFEAEVVPASLVEADI
jgi:hypothetical protein